MDINRNNYHVWISDYYDRALSDLEVVSLHNFLDLNPDLKAEFLDFGNMILHPDISLRMDKALLKKELSETNEEVLEHYAIAYSENDLTDEQEREVSILFTESPSAKNIFRDYKKIKLTPGNAIYPNKLKLKRIPFRVGFIKAGLRVGAIAATIALIISLSLLLPRQQESSITYNTAYLLPFNSSENLTDPGRVGNLAPILTANRTPLKQISIQEAPSIALIAEEEVPRDSYVLVHQAYISEVVISSELFTGNLANMKEADFLLPNEIARDLSPRQFVAMNFRKFLLKEDEDNTDKLKVYEVADVSINGLSKIMGWEMQFEKEKTEDGKLASFKFTSQLLNFDHVTKNVTE